MDNTELLAALDEAYKILSRAAVDCAPIASTLPYTRVHHARQYIVAQANELLEPVFSLADSLGVSR